jgi:hypothetical protein
VKRPSKFDGESATPASEASSPSGPPLGSNLIPFPAPPQLPGREGAGVTSASASSFELLGAITHAVVLRLQGGFPKIKVGRVTEGGGPATRPGTQSAAWEEE